MPCKIFVDAAFRSAIASDKLAGLVKLFRQYKDTGVAPPIFGRDAPYDFPPTIARSGLAHIHIKDQKASKNWSLHRVRLHLKTSDTALIYCSGYFHNDHYLLLDLLENAHSYYKPPQFHMLTLAELAEKFREKY